MFVDVRLPLHAEGLQSLGRVLGRHGYQGLLLAPPRDPNAHLGASPGAQPLLYDHQLVSPGLQEKLLRDRGGFIIELLEERTHDLARIRVLRTIKDEVVAPDQLAAHEDYFG